MVAGVLTPDTFGFLPGSVVALVVEAGGAGSDVGAGVDASLPVVETAGSAFTGAGGVESVTLVGTALLALESLLTPTAAPAGMVVSLTVLSTAAVVAVST